LNFADIVERKLYKLTSANYADRSSSLFALNAILSTKIITLIAMILVFYKK
jgi:hypothetical protein